jgi:DNA-directed RNA polymerase II subunit RPB1
VLKLVCCKCSHLLADISAGDQNQAEGENTEK